MSLLLKNLRLPLARFTLELEAQLDGRVTAIFGPSGAGKTTLLDIVAGLRRPLQGSIQLDDRVLDDTARNVRVPPQHRNLGYVPQDLALFPHLSVRQNLLYGRRGPKETDAAFRFDHVVEVLEIQPLAERGVEDLSGGEKQRVALARALLTAPQLLLLDEPLASLDLKLKMRIIPFFRRIRDEFRVPMLYVTHDRLETVSLADDMLVLVEGKVAQHGPVPQVLSRPANLDVAGLLSVETILPGRVVDSAEGLTRVIAGATPLTAATELPFQSGAEVHVCIRAEDVILSQGKGPSSARNHLPGMVRSITLEGPVARVELDCGFTLSALLTKQACDELKLKAGDPVAALIKAPHIHLIAR
jgi:molybdate transport system ATP-binding protein